MNKIELKYHFFTVLAICFVVIIGVAAVSKLKEKQDAQHLLEKVATEQLTAETVSEVPDYYGTPIKLEKVATEECITVNAVSAGSDHIFGNDDDISCVKRNYNKSRVVGKWISQKSKEFFKGVVSGIVE